mgnify:CR=1 FL=1
MSALICGIDPGISGAVGFLTEAGDFHAVFDMPVATNTTGRKQIDGLGLAAILRRQLPAIAIIERVGPRPGEGPTGAFSFGHSVGVIQGVLSALAVPYTFISPVTWKRAAGIPPGADKSASIAVARQLIPSAGDHLTRIKDHGRAEALLLAHHHLTRR